jgi:hypothetical protein
MQKPLIIFIMGKAQSGKDTIAEIIAEKIEYGYKNNYYEVITLAFADTLKNVCKRNHGFHNKYRDRDILIEIGDLMRRQDPSVFIKPVSHFIDIYKKLNYKVFIITDMRFENEYNSLLEMQDAIPFVIKVQSLYEHKNITAFAKSHPTENLEFIPDYNIVLPLLTQKEMTKIEKIIEEVVFDILNKYLLEQS